MDELVEVVGILRLKREDVSSGVYLIMIYGEDGSRHEEKITVINKK